MEASADELDVVFCHTALLRAVQPALVSRRCMWSLPVFSCLVLDGLTSFSAPSSAGLRRVTATLCFLGKYIYILARCGTLGCTHGYVRSVLDEGPPEELVANFCKLFSANIEHTKAEAIRAAKHYGPLPELF